MPDVLLIDWGAGKGMPPVETRREYVPVGSNAPSLARTVSTGSRPFPFDGGCLVAVDAPPGEREAQRVLSFRHPRAFTAKRVTPAGTVGRRDAAVERTGMYSQRVPAGVTRFAQPCRQAAHDQAQLKGRLP